MDCETIIREVLKPISSNGRGVTYMSGTSDVVYVVLNSMWSVSFHMRDAKITACLPDTIARWFGAKEFTFNLYDIKSLDNIKQFVGDVILIAEKHMVPNQSFTNFGNLSEEDITVIIDLFLERLPMVWQDASEEIKRGKSLRSVLKEMEEGHIIRILKRLKHDIGPWLKEFEEFHAQHP